MNRRLNSCVAAGIFALLAGSWSASLWAEHVILEPGWITGQADVATHGQIVQSLSVNAYGTGEGSGHRASKSISQSYTTGNLVPLDYSLTVQGGTLDDQGETWDYRVRATATARTDPDFCPEHAPNCRNAYTNIYFSDRYFPVAIDQTVTNNYAADATIRYQLDITDITDSSDPSLDNEITGWRAYGYAYKNVPAGEERTNSRSYTHSSYTPCESHSNETPCGAWDMPVVGNAGVRVYASITVYGNALRDDGTRYNYAKGYAVYNTVDYVNNTNDYLYVDVGTDETNHVVVVPLSVEHVAPPPPKVVTYEYGTVEGTINLNFTYGDIDYSEQLFTYPTWPYSYHRVYSWGNAYIYTNPGDYLLNNERTGTRTYRALSYLNDEENTQTLYWPYTGGDSTNDQITVVEDQIARKDFINETGMLSGQLLFNGSLKTRDLDWYQLRAYGSRHYEPGQGWVYQPTYGGESFESVTIDPTAPDKSYRMFLTPGPWQPYYIRARANNTELLGYSGWSDITLYDYSHYYDGNYYDFGQPTDIAGGISKQQNFNYKTGGVSMCFEAVEHSLNLRDPYVYGSAYFDKDGKREMQVNVTGWSDTDLMPDPEAILYGPEGIYNLTPRAYTEDDTYITFPSREVTLSQKVFKKRCLTSADIKIDNYEFDLTTEVGTDTATAAVTGSAADDDGILRIEFWQDGVQVHVIDYSATAEALVLAQTDVTSGLLPTSVDFSYDFTLTAGLHTVRVVAVDGLGNESYDEWEIEVNTAPVANDDSLETLEDNPLTITVATLLANDSDADGDTLVIDSLPASTHGVVVDNEDGTLTYTPSTDYWGTGSFLYTVSDGRGGTAEATVTITIMPVNDGPPVANDDAYSTNEDVKLEIAAPGVLANDTDIDGDPLTAALVTAPVNGTVVVNPDGSFSYTPKADYNGPDSFTYQASDGMGGTGSGTVDITINAVNDPPQVLVDTASQWVQYSDAIVPVTISAVDIDSAPSALTATWTDLPDGLSMSGGCTGTGSSSCTWTLEGNALVSEGTYAITFTLSDGEFAPIANTEVIVELEEASAAFDDSNPVSVRVATDGGTSGPFSLIVHVHESDETVGELSNAVVSMSLAPVGPGASASGTCAATSTDGTAKCDFNFNGVPDDGVPVNTYTVEVTIDGDYYTGSAEDVLTVYDPSLGFTTGGGWFNWPVTGDKTNFGYTMKYGKKGTNVRGSLLLIRHLDDGTKYRIKSNALDALAIGSGSDESGPYGTASFSGKSTYLEPGMPEPEGNHGFTVYVEDRNEPGSGADRFWITTRAKDGSTIPAMSLPESAPDNAEAIQGGNIVAPH